jgi:tRNA(Ile)-lysidine synthase
METLIPLVQRVAALIERHRMLPPGARLGVAVSGGADSVCLLHVLRELALAPLTILHLDHQLRGEESRRDSEFVASMAAALELPIVTRTAVLPSGNVEQEGRRARLAVFRDVIRSGAVDRVATGHTRSDQAETVLFRLLRGAADAGLSGIHPVTEGGLIRPLLEVERADVEQYLTERGIAWRVDSTNASPRFARNRIRHELLPLLEREWNPEIVATLARTADWALAEGDYWRAEIDRLETAALAREGDAVLLKASVLNQLPVAVGRRLVRRAVERTKGDLRGIGFVSINRVLRLAGSDRGSGAIELPGVTVNRSLDWLRFVIFADADAPSGKYRMAVSVPGYIPIPGTGTAISLELIEKPADSVPSDCVYNQGMGWVDWDRVAGSLELRSWMPGDRFQPARSAGSRKLKTFFQLARIPQWERCHWPVLTNGDSIVWTRRFGVSAGFAPGPRTRAILRVREMAAA